jgi:hypothetical protein
VQGTFELGTSVRLRLTAADVVTRSLELEPA